MTQKPSRSFVPLTPKLLRWETLRRKHNTTKTCEALYEVLRVQFCFHLREATPNTRGPHTFVSPTQGDEGAAYADPSYARIMYI